MNLGIGDARKNFTLHFNVTKLKLINNVTL